MTTQEDEFVVWTRETRMKRAKLTVNAMLIGGLFVALLGILVAVWSEWSGPLMAGIRLSVTGIVVWVAGLLAKVVLQETGKW